MKKEKIKIIRLKKRVCKKPYTFIIIYGMPKIRKTTLGFHKQLYKRYFATSCEDIGNKLKNNPISSFCFIDEGLDIKKMYEEKGLKTKTYEEIVKMLKEVDLK